VQVSENKISEFEQQLLPVLESLQRVKSSIAQLKKEKQELEKENIHLNKLLKIQKNTIRDLEESLKTKKVAKLISSKDNTTAKHTLNALISEIERCIKLVQAQ